MNKRLSCNIPKMLYDKLKRRAKSKNITITRYVTRALLRYIIKEDSYEI